MVDPGEDEFEVESLKAIHSRFICGLHYCYQTPTDVCLVLDLLHGGTLSYLLQQHKKLPERHVCFFAACMVLAYEALHTAGFVYRDMKPANVLLKSNGYCCLTDFGLTAKVASALKGKCGDRLHYALAALLMARTSPPSLNRRQIASKASTSASAVARHVARGSRGKSEVDFHSLHLFDRYSR